MKKGTVSVIVLILAALVLAGGYYSLIYQPNRQLNSSEDTTNIDQPIVGGDRDEHGCIGTAGYTWCEIKNTCLREWEEPCEVNTTPVDETQIILSAMKTAIIAKRGAGAADMTYTVSKVEGNYAQGGAAVPEGGGGMWFAAKVNGIWSLVWDGNGVILCSDIALYPAFPVSMIPECYDSDSNTSVQRE